MNDFEILISALNLLSTSILGFIAFKLTKRYSQKNQQLNEDVIFHQLFRDFNVRYDSLNNYLDNLKYMEITWQELCNHTSHREYKNAIIDYLNLCAEERFWKEKGRIPKEIWKSWSAGMEYWYQELKPIRDAWEDEKKGNGYQSYYLRKGEFLFESEKFNGEEN